MADKKYTLSVELQGDASEAIKALRETAKNAERMGAAVSKPLQVNVDQNSVDKANRSLNRIGGGLYSKAFKGVGGDFMKIAGLDKVGFGLASGLGKPLSWAAAGFSAVGKVAALAFRGIFTGLRLAGSLIKSALLAPLSLAKGAFKALGLAAGASLAGIYAGLKALGPAADMQQYTIQIETMLKDPGKAKQRLAELSKYAKDTNYNAKEVIEAGNLMQAFGFYALKDLKLAGDAANAFNKDIREVVTSLSYIATGRGSMALRSLASLGITRPKLQDVGVRFSKSGEMLTEPKKALRAVLQVFERDFGGMTARQSHTWKGALQQAGGEVFTAMSRGFAGVLKPFTAIVQKRIIPLIESVGERLATINWNKALERPVRLVGGLLEALRQFADPASGKAAAVAFKGIWDTGKGLFAGVLKAMADLGVAFLRDLGATFQRFTEGGMFAKLGTLMYNSVALGWQLGATLFREVLAGFSNDFISQLKVFVNAWKPALFQDESNKRAKAKSRALSGIDALIQSDPAFGHHRYAVEQAAARAEAEALRLNAGIHPDLARSAAQNAREKARQEAVERIVKSSPRLQDKYDQMFAGHMGWDSTPADQAEQARNKLKNTFRDFSSSLGEFGKFKPATDNMKAARAKLGGSVSAIGDFASGLAGDFNRMAAIRERYNQRIAQVEASIEGIKGEPGLERLRLRGYTKEGAERRSGDYVKDSAYQDERIKYEAARQEQAARIKALEAERARLLRDRAKAEQSLREQLPAAGGNKDGNGQQLGSIDSGIKQLGVQIAQIRLQDKGVLAALEKNNQLLNAVLGV